MLCHIVRTVSPAAAEFRSQFSEEFRDSSSFGWENGSQHNFDWKVLVAKKVSTWLAVSAQFGQQIKPAQAATQVRILYIPCICRPKKSQG